MAYLPAFTWASTEWAVRCAQLGRVFADIDLETWLMGLTGMKGQIAMPMSTFGAAIKPEEYEGHVLVDAAHAVGTPMKLDKVAGAVFSLAPSKLWTAGEGGCLVTHDAALATAFSELRHKFARLSELNAAMALAQWGGIDAYLRDRRLRCEKYREVTGWKYQLATPTNYSTAAFLVVDRDKKVERLKELGIETRVYYVPLWNDVKLPNTKWVYEHIICLPNYYQCPTDEVVKALEALKER